MFVTPDNDQLRLITQGDHARLASHLFSLWKSDGIPRHPRRVQLIRAIREHDNGWREADSAPMLSPEDGRPVDLFSMPERERLAIWHRGVRRYRHDDPYVALLTTLHAIHLHTERASDADGWVDAITNWQELSADLMRETGMSEHDARSDYRWLKLADRVSLTVCRDDRTQDLELEPGRTGFWDGATLRLRPFSLAGTTTFRVPARWIEDRSYRSAEGLITELSTRRWGSFDVQVAGFGRQTS